MKESCRLVIPYNHRRRSPNFRLALRGLPLLQPFLCLLLLQRGLDLPDPFSPPRATLWAVDEHGLREPLFPARGLLRLLLLLLLVALAEAAKRCLQQRAVLRVELLELSWLDLVCARAEKGVDWIGNARGAR